MTKRLLISSNSTTALVPAYVKIENRGFAASTSRIAKLGYRDEEIISQYGPSTRHTLAKRLSANASRG